MLRAVRLIIPVMSIFVLVSCGESEQQKLSKLTEIQKQNREMKEAITAMQREAEKVVLIHDMEQKLLQCETNIMEQTQKNKQLDASIDAFTVRRDAMRIKLEDFRRSHPAD